MSGTERDAPARLGRHVDLAPLGRGAMGAVYSARDPELDRPVAIKVMQQVSPDWVARFRREAQAVARLVHPNIVQVFDVGTDEAGNPFFVMEMVDGTPLDHVVRQRGRLPPAEVACILRQAAAGLDAAHAAGVVHRDVKPSNLILDRGGTVKLLDFGVARVLGGSASAQLTAPASLMGTPSYMAPEQAGGRPVDQRADIYALGLTAFELLAGDPAFHAEDLIALALKQVNDPLPDLRTRVPGVPEGLARLVERMAAKKPEDRPQSAGEVVRALDGILAELSGGAAAVMPTVALPGSGSAPEVPPSSPSAGARRWARGPLVLGLVSVADPQFVYARSDLDALENRMRGYTQTAVKAQEKANAELVQRLAGERDPMKAAAAYTQLAGNLMTQRRWKRLLAESRALLANPPPPAGSGGYTLDASEQARVNVVRAHEQLAEWDDMLREGERFLKLHPTSQQFTIVKMLMDVAIEKKRQRDEGAPRAAAEIAQLPSAERADPCRTSLVYQSHHQDADLRKALEACIERGGTPGAPGVAEFRLVFACWALADHRGSARWIGVLRAKFPDQYRNVKHLESMMPVED